MRARVIKEWEMSGITHKVGEIMTIPLHSPGGLPMTSDIDAFLLNNGFIEEIEEPLIKDEKVRKAVRAWAEACCIELIEITHSRKSILRAMDAITGNDEICINREIGQILDEKVYNIEELCGEEE